MESTFTIIDMLPTYGLLCYAVFSVCVVITFRSLTWSGGNRHCPRTAVVALLVGSASVALLAYAAYIIAMPYAQPDMVDFYHMYQPVVPLFLTGCFAVQFVCGVAAATGWRGRRR